MPLPANLSTGTVTGSGLTKGTTLAFIASVARITDGTNIVDLSPYNVSVGPSGAFSIVLPATNDVDYTPINWTYRVAGLSPDGDHFNFSMALAGGTTVNIATVPQVVESSGIVLATPAPPYIDARTYGVLFDDSTDNSVALQNAFNAVIAAKGTLDLAPGNARFSTPLSLANAQCVRIRGASGSGQGTIDPASRLVYTGGDTARVIDARSTRGTEIHDVAIQHTSSALTGYLVDLGLNVAGSSRHLLRRVLLGSTSPSTVKTAKAVGLDGCYDIALEGIGLVGLATGVQGTIAIADGGKGFANGVRVLGGFGSDINGYHFVNGGKSWEIEDYVAEPNGTVPNLLSVSSTGGDPLPVITLINVHCDDATATGNNQSWCEFGKGSLTIIGGYFRVGDGSAVRLTGTTKAVTILGALTVYTNAAAGAILDGNAQTLTSLTLAGNRLTNSSGTDGGTRVKGSITVTNGFEQMLDGHKVSGKIGFYGMPPIAQQTGVAVTAAAIHAALVNLGLITA